MVISKANAFRTKRYCFELTQNYKNVTKATECTFKTVNSNNLKIIIDMYFKNRDVYFVSLSESPFPLNHLVTDRC